MKTLMICKAIGCPRKKYCASAKPHEETKNCKEKCFLMGKQQPINIKCEKITI